MFKNIQDTYLEGSAVDTRGSSFSSASKAREFKAFVGRNIASGQITPVQAISLRGRASSELCCSDFVHIRGAGRGQSRQEESRKSERLHDDL
jgi:hypothetical protein